jgi:ComF family protein
MLSNRWTNKLNNCLRLMQLPQQCTLCGLRSGRAALCEPCWQDLPWLARASCPRCALPAPGGELCGACLKRAPQFDETRAALRYEFPVAELVHAYKYRNQVGLAHAFERMLRRRVREGAAAQIDTLVPLPVTRARMRERGFNQAAELAKLLGRELALPVNLRALRKIRETRPQIELPWDERRANVRGAFACDAALAGKNVALIDDVMTTGASADAASRALKQAGAKSVTVWVLARALRQP